MISVDCIMNALKHCKVRLPFFYTPCRSPDFNIQTFIENLRNDLSEIQESAEVILLGDFNVDYQLRSTAKSRL